MKLLTINLPKNISEKELENTAHSYIESMKYHIKKNNWNCSLLIAPAPYAPINRVDTLMYRGKENTAGKGSKRNKLHKIKSQFKEKSHLHIIALGKNINQITKQTRLYFIKKFNNQFGLELEKINQDQKLFHAKNIKNGEEGLVKAIHYCINQSRIHRTAGNFDFEQYIGATVVEQQENRVEEQQVSLTKSADQIKESTAEQAILIAESQTHRITAKAEYFP